MSTERVRPGGPSALVVATVRAVAGACRSGAAAGTACALLFGVAGANAAAAAPPAPATAPDAMPPAPLPPLERVMNVPPRDVGAFTLVDQRGRAFDSAALRGTPAFVFFGFTHCPDVCPGTLAKLRLALRGDESPLHDVRVVMITADPERDTPETLARYLEFFGKDFIGLGGDPRAVREVASRFRAAFYRGATRADGDYAVDHSYQVFAVDGAGRVRAELYDAPPESIATVARTLLAEARRAPARAR